MGLFDLPGPLLYAADDLLSFLPPLPRLLLWAVATGALSMLVYWLLSAQEKVGQAKRAALEARRALNSYEGHEFTEMWPLVRASLACSGRHFWIVLGPTLLGSLPALALIIWVSNQFGYVLPAPGAPLKVSTAPAMELKPSIISDTIQVITYPSLENTLVIKTRAGDVPLVSLPLRAAVPVVHKRAWWNSLIGNPAGYLDSASPADELRFDLARQRFLSIGPSWLQTWELPYFLMLILSSLAIKIAFRID